MIAVKTCIRLSSRVSAQTATAKHLAEKLEGNPALSRVIYPGLASHAQHDLAMRQLGAGGTVLSFDIRGGREAAFAFLNHLEIAVISNNLGDAKTIATPPAFTTHQRLPDDQKQILGITPGLIRLSCGLEDPQDLLRDLEAALEIATRGQT